MQLIWYGNAGIIIRSENSVIAFDPFLGIPLNHRRHSDSSMAYAEEYKKVKDIFITHGHFDHIYDLPDLYACTEAKIYCTSTPAKTLSKRALKDNIRIIAPNQQIDVGDITVKTFKGRHCKFDSKLILNTVFRKDTLINFPHFLNLLRIDVTYPENGEILFYEVSCGGKRIQVIGSMNLDENTDYPKGADILVLPLQGRSDLDTYPIKMVERLKPKSIVLDHCDNSFPPITQDIDVSGFTANLRAHFDIPCIRPRYGEIITTERILQEAN